MRKKEAAPAASVTEQPVEQPAAAIEQPSGDPAAPARKQVEQPGVEETAHPSPVEVPPVRDPEPDLHLPPAEIEPLAAYATRVEEEAQPLPVCQITHPDAKDGTVHVGKYAGIRLVCGDIPAALLSNGYVV